MDGKCHARSGHEVGAEEISLDKPSGDRTARVPEACEGVYPERATLNSSLLYTGTEEQ